MQSIEKMLNDGTFRQHHQKRTPHTFPAKRTKKEKVLGGIAQLGRVPAALFIVDIGHEHIALAEAKRLGITTFGMVDTNCDPNKVDFRYPCKRRPLPSLSRSSVNYVTAAIAEGLAERQAAKEEDVEENSGERMKMKRRAARLQAEAESRSCPRPGRKGEEERASRNVASRIHGPASPRGTALKGRCGTSSDRI